MEGINFQCILKDIANAVAKAENNATEHLEEWEKRFQELISISPEDYLQFIKQTYCFMILDLKDNKEYKESLKQAEDNGN